MKNFSLVLSIVIMLFVVMTGMSSAENVLGQEGETATPVPTCWDGSWSVLGCPWTPDGIHCYDCVLVCDESGWCEYPTYVPTSTPPSEFAPYPAPEDPIATIEPYPAPDNDNESIFAIYVTATPTPMPTVTYVEECVDMGTYSLCVR